ncbi:MAG: hypothetical protein R3B36_36940 [Polyangiaceae bacterium]
MASLGAAALVVPACSSDVEEAPARPTLDSGTTGEGGGGEGGTSSDGSADTGPEGPTKVLDLDTQTTLKNEIEVSTWLDATGNNNTAVATPTPLAVEPGINGRPAVRFDGAHHMVLADSPTLQVGTEDFLLAVVAMWEEADTAQSHVIFAKQLGAAPLTGPAIMANHAFLPGDPTDRSTSVAVVLRDGTKAESVAVRAVPAPDPSKPHLIVLRRAAGVLELRVDRTAKGTTTFDRNLDASAIGSAAALGGDGQAGRYLKGFIGQVVLYRGTVSTRELGNIEGGLHNRWLTIVDAGAPKDAGNDG